MRLSLLALALLSALLAPWAARADDPAAAALAKLASGNFNQIEAGIVELSVSGHPRALEILEALNAGDLSAAPDGTLIGKSAAGTVNAATGEKAEAAGAKPIKLNNRVRRAVEAAMGNLTLMAKDPAKRLTAAEAVFKSRDPAAAPILKAALLKESDPKVKRALEFAQAAVALTDPAAAEADRLEAVAKLAGRGDQESKNLLQAARGGAGEAMGKAIDKAVADIESRLALMQTAQNIWYGLSLGSVLLLAAIGLAITFGVMGIINMAHGEMVMLGAYTTFMVQNYIRAHHPGLFDWSLPIALPLAFLVAGAVGVLMERSIIRFLYGRPLETLLATWGVSLMLQQTVRSIFGPTNQEVGAPSYMAGYFEWMGLQITYGRMWIIVFSLVVFFTLLAVMRATSFGLKMRAVTQNRRMAACMGIRTPWVDSLTFGLGSGIAGIAGVALSQIDNVSPNLGQSYIIDSFMVVVFGGVGNLWGTLVAALSLGVANKFLEPLAGAVLAKILVLVFIILFIQKRPRGLFALKGRAVEA
jgi:urea transport system permease protein